MHGSRQHLASESESVFAGPVDVVTVYRSPDYVPELISLAGVLARREDHLLVVCLPTRQQRYVTVQEDILLQSPLREWYC